VNITLRIFKPDDFDALYEIDQACYEPEVAYSQRELRAYLRFSGSDCLVAYAEAQAKAEALPLFRQIKAAWDLHSLDDFVRNVNSNPDFAKLFPPILAAADGADALAQRVLAQAGRELAQLAEMVIRRLFAEDIVVVPLAMAGGVFRHSSKVREVFRHELGMFESRIDVNPQVVEPVAGALQMARKGKTAQK